MDTVAHPTIMLQKVLAYITRPSGASQEVLVFRHRDHPEGGLQVPGGTVTLDEPLDEAVRREVTEESGLSELVLIGQIARAPFHAQGTNEWQERNVFHLEARADLPDRWTHIVQAQGEDRGLAFVFGWMPVDEAASRLCGGQGQWLHLLSVVNGETMVLMNPELMNPEPLNPEPPESTQPLLNEAQAPGAARLITHRFPMRGGFLDVRLPYDLKRAEAVRLAQFIESLAT